MVLRTFYSSISFRHWTKNFWTLDGKCFHTDSKTAFYMSRQGFTDFFSKELNLLSKFFGFWLRTVRNLIEIFPEGCIKRHYVCPEQQFEEKSLLKIFFSLYHFRTFIGKTSHDLQKFEHGCHSYFSYVRRNTLQAKGFFLKKSFNLLI